MGENKLNVCAKVLVDIHGFFSVLFRLSITQKQKMCEGQMKLVLFIFFFSQTLKKCRI